MATTHHIDTASGCTYITAQPSTGFSFGEAPSYWESDGGYECQVDAVCPCCGVTVPAAGNGLSEIVFGCKCGWGLTIDEAGVDCDDDVEALLADDALCYAGE